jgi:predicted lactoylglutathione lyase
MNSTHAKQLFLNLPVKDLEKSQNFYEALGFSINPIFTDAEQKCLVWCDEIYVMLHAIAFSEKHVKKPLANFQSLAGPSFTLTLANQEQVFVLTEQALNAGGLAIAPQVDAAYMTLRTIEDPDGYSWGFLYIDMPNFQALSTPNA